MVIDPEFLLQQVRDTPQPFLFAKPWPNLTGVNPGRAVSCSACASPPSGQSTRGPPAQTQHPNRNGAATTTMGVARCALLEQSYKLTDLRSRHMVAPTLLASRKAIHASVAPSGSLLLIQLHHIRSVNTGNRGHTSSVAFCRPSILAA